MALLIFTTYRNFIICVFTRLTALLSQIYVKKCYKSVVLETHVQLIKKQLLTF